ncbi:Cyclin-U4-3 [Dactylellina cionopaga]|nr:Cyclin-U4-3 [Dactylellina cionopaga]
MSVHHRNASLTPPDSPATASSPESSSRSLSSGQRSTSSRSSFSSAASSSSNALPAAPHPSADMESGPCPTVRFASQSSNPTEDPTTTYDIFKMPPTTALQLLARSMEFLVSCTPESKFQAPVSIKPSAAFPNIASNPSWVNPYPGHRSPVVSPSFQSTSPESSEGGFAFTTTCVDNIDGVTVRRKAVSPAVSGMPFSPPPQPLNSPDDRFTGKVIAEGVEAMDNMTQYSTITRKFWSKTAPPISVEDYLFRIHRYCPLSTSVYLAASLYLHRLAIKENILPITTLSVHRALVAALRVAAKSIEDCTHSQKLFAKVAGLSEVELSKLEVSFCFLTGFDLTVNESMLRNQSEVLRKQAEMQVRVGTAGLMKRGRLTINDDGDLVVRERSRSRVRGKSPAPRKVMMDV